MENYKRIYELTYDKLNTLDNLLNHIRYDEYTEVSFKKNHIGIIAELKYEKDGETAQYECQFGSNEMLSTIYIIKDDTRKLMFDREYELTIEKGTYLLEEFNKAQSKNKKMKKAL